MEKYSDPASDPVVIVGMACRLPGAVDSPSTLWKLLEEQRSGQCDVPESRFNIDAFYQPGSSEVPGGMNMRGGYFIKEDIREFDNEFFGILSAEATYMDPQQRKLLEVVFESFESAGISLDKISNSDTGTYVCNFASDFITMQTKDPEYMDRYSATGMGATILGNRVSHTFNMLGPSQVIDTACSSALYCLNSACAALQSGDCNAAVVAGANLIQSIEQHLGMMKAGVLSPTSTCHTFSDEADGYARADGVGSLYLKRLSDALRDNDPVRAVIRGTAVGSNGKTRGISAPSAGAQEAVIRRAYQKVGISPSETAYIECHGTGTPAGDPIEVEAISRVFQRKSDNPLLIGSIKTNVGHGEAVSGLSGIIKTVLALEKGKIPPTIGVRRINPKIRANEWGVEIVTKTREWPVDRLGSSESCVRRAGVNSFGYGGANGHVILEGVPATLKLEQALTRKTSYPNGSLSANVKSLNSVNFGSVSTKIQSTNTSESDDISSTEVSDSLSSRVTADPESSEGSEDLCMRSSFLLPFSPSNETALKARVSGIAAMHTETMDLVDLAYTLGCRRTHFAERGFIVAKRGSLPNDLSEERLQILPSVKPSGSPADLAFVFTGQGAQWPGMGKELFDEFSIFRQSIRHMDTVLKSVPHPPQWTIESTLFEPAETSEIHNAGCAQPMATALQVATVELLDSWGVHPKRVVGHSSGEVAAAFAAGYLSCAEAITAAYYRGYLNSVNKLDGAMMAVGLGCGEAEAEVRQAGMNGKVGIACVNSPVSVTMSGDSDAVTTLSKVLQGRGIFARKLNTGGKAYHSHHMAALGPELERLLPLAMKRLPASRYLRNDTEYISSVTGEPKCTDFDAVYWRTNMESPVLFSQAVECLIEKGDVHLVEIGPHSALELPLKQIRKELKISEDRIPYSSSLMRSRNAAECSLNLLGRLFLYGLPMSFHVINTQDVAISPRVLTDLPPYPRTYDGILWSESRVSRETRYRKDRHHELLGSQVPGGDGLTRSWRNMLQTRHVSWLEAHRLEQTIVFPGAGYVAMAMEAISQILDTARTGASTFSLRNTNILAALVLAPETETEIFTTLRPKPLSSATKSKEWWNFEIVSYTDGYSNLHAGGSIGLKSPQGPALPMIPFLDLGSNSTVARPWYDRFAKVGLNFGPDFRSIKNVSVQARSNDPHRHAKTLVPFHKNSSYSIHPITIDALFQSGIIANAGSVRKLQAKVPLSIGFAEFHTPEKPPEDLCSIFATAETVGFGAIGMAAELRHNGNIYAELRDVRMAPYSPAAPSEPRLPMLRTVWKPDLYTSCWTSDSFSRYLNRKSSSSTAGTDFAIPKVVSLLTHRNPRANILELSHKGAEFGNWFTEDFPPTMTSYTAGYLSGEGKLFGTIVKIGTMPTNSVVSSSELLIGNYDLVVLPDTVSSDLYLHAMLPKLGDLLTEDGMLLAAVSPTQKYGFDQQGFTVIQRHQQSIDDCLILARRFVHDQGDADTIFVVERDDPSLPSQVLASNLTGSLASSPVKSIKFSEITEDAIRSGAKIFSLLEVEKPLLSTLAEDDMVRLKLLVENASSLVWATGGGFLNESRPDFALASGLARVLMIEQPSLGFYTFDIDSGDVESLETAQNLSAVLQQPKKIASDYEFVQHKGMVYVSRFVPDDDSNQTFRQRQGNETTSMSLAEARPSRLNIGSLGQFNTIKFKKQPSQPLTLEPGYVEVEVQAVGLNAKGCAVLSGKHETRDGACTLEHCGVVTRISEGVGYLQGHRVVVMAPGHFNTHEIVPQWACCKLRDDEKFDICCTLPVVYSNAIYALHHRAGIQPGEKVLIHSGADEVGNAAIQIAKLAGAEIFTTAGTEIQRKFLISKFHLQPENVFSSQDDRFYGCIFTATNGKGVDVVLNSLTGDLLHLSWSLCAAFGRFIELGNRDLVDSGILEMDVFKRGASFTAIDMGRLFYDDHSSAKETWSSLLANVMELYRNGVIHPIEPLETYDVCQMPQALRRFFAGNRTGKVAVSFEDPQSVVQVHPLKYNTVLDPAKSYVLVGCLGGLGRSISKWMIARGACKFSFLGRSGTDKPTARAIVRELESAGATVSVVRGDVASSEDVKRLLDQVEGNVGGVVHAAMGLSEALFTKMTHQSWHTGIDPKLYGCWNLHNAIKGKDDELDFFFMTSSVSGSIGQAAQANYCAANHSLDVFARYRKALGVPATAVGFGMISEVGYLHENPDIEAILSRSGITALDEDEMLQIVDIALSQKPNDSLDWYSQSHILTGMESKDVDSFPAKNDPRTALLLASLEKESSTITDTHEEDGNAEPEETDPQGKAIAKIRKQIAKALAMQLEKVNVNKNLATYGMDSMMATEFRTWLFQTFKKDIPFFDLLDAGTTIESLASKVLATS